jgi:hypothetical protein
MSRNAYQDPDSSRDSQEDSQLLDTTKLEEAMARHKTTVFFLIEAVIDTNWPSVQVKTRRRTVENRLRQAQTTGFAELSARGQREIAEFKEDLCELF